MCMWLVFAFGSAIFAGVTSILAKRGIRKTDSAVATAIRTVVVLAFSGLVFHEKLTRRAAVGLLLVTGGTLVMLF